MTVETHRASLAGYPPMVVHKFTIRSVFGRQGQVYDVASCQWEPSGGYYSARSLKSSAAHKLARLMVDAGEADGPIQAFGPEGQMLYAAPSLHAFAKFTIQEEPRTRRIRYHARMGFDVSGQSDAPDMLTDPNAACGASGAGEGT